MLLTLHEENISDRQIDTILEALQNEQICIVPTDTLYAFVCDISSRKAVKQLALLKGKKLEKSNFSFLCNSISMASKYIKPLTNEQYTFIKRLDTGGFTFILMANNLTPKIFQNKKRTIGIRITKNILLNQIITALNRPLLVSSVDHEDIDFEEFTNIELLYEKYKNDIGLAVDCSQGKNIPSTVVDLCQSNDFKIIREGLGKIDD